MIKLVLLIEDDSITQFLNRHIIESFAFCENIIEAANGLEALNYYEKLENGAEPIENVPEVIILDLNMPILDGWEFFESFKNKYPNFLEKTKVFVLSSSINPEDIRRANNDRNIAAFLEKPLDNDKLEVIRHILDKK
jgi:CheY-like chemotaxis protein